MIKTDQRKFKCDECRDWGFVLVTYTGGRYPDWVQCPQCNRPEIMMELAEDYGRRRRSREATEAMRADLQRVKAEASA